MHILVTGGNGFLGKAIIKRLLNAGHTVRSFNRRASPPLTALGVACITGDLLDKPALIKATEGVEAIFHVAAKAGIWGSYRSYFEPNVIGTRNLLAAAQTTNVPYFIHTSTASVVFNGQPLFKGNEALPYGRKCLCAYALTKALAEKEVLAENGKGNLLTLALRPHLIWGPGDPHLFPRLVQRAEQNSLVQIGTGHNWVDLTHVDNVAHAHLQALKALQSGKGQGKAYFITQNEPVPLWPWINSFLKTIGLSPVNKKMAQKTGYALGSFLEALHSPLPFLGEPSLTRFLALELALDHTFSTAAANRDLDYHPILSFAEGMEERTHYWKHYLGSR